VLGDLNDFQFSESLAAIEETGLTNLVETLPIEAQYNNIFAGNAQMLDQMLSSAALRVEQFQPLHLNAEFPASRRLSDHDPLVAAFSLD
jgi:predicted extracellular nuclease